jgi:hypothetical protein
VNKTLRTYYNMLVSHKKAGKKCLIRSRQRQRIFPLTSCPDQLWGPHSLLSHGYQGGLSPGVKRGWSMTLITHSYLGLRLRMSRSYTSPPPQAPPWHVVGQLRVTHEDYMHKEIKSRLNLWNACYRSVHRISSSCLLSRNVEVEYCNE